MNPIANIFAFSVSLLTVNITDSVSNTDLAPASISKTTAGATTLTWVLTPGLNYYIPDPVNPISSSAITVDISGMPSSTNPQTPTAARNSGEFQYKPSEGLSYCAGSSRQDL